MKSVRIGIAGLGNMGSAHARQILDGKIPRMELAAVWDTAPAKMEPFSQVKHFSNSETMIRSGEIDAILIATPHYSHTTIGIDALKSGLHVLVEKPISVHKADCQKLIAAHKNRRQVFAAMFNQRTDPFYIKIREMVRGGELGKIRRVSWTITNWFRPDAYYASSDWRATWRGEGGGVLLNQCPHNLDLLQWILGMPAKVRGFCCIGHYHKIEVEDDVTAWFEYPNGASGVFITSTGEAPGVNRLEIAGDLGRLVYENDAIRFTRNEIETSKFCRTSKEAFAAPATHEEAISVESHGGQHNAILKNFADAILDGAHLIAPAKEGIHSVELANAILLSSFEQKTIALPMNANAYRKKLESLIKNSKFKKKTKKTAVTDLSKSFR
ncbi:MAG TPA: Gfo/Idh/MocA family oxidoreductase [Chthoniobacteraceae bacterium]|nr:Gfo/Idh/MocA family oxidoreductase [Chthoniobacteraceae bacterium]